MDKINKIPDLGKVKNPYLGDYSCWKSDTLFFKANRKLYYYDGWEMFLSDCEEVSHKSLVTKYTKIVNKLEDIKKKLYE